MGETQVWVSFETLCPFIILIDISIHTSILSSGESQNTDIHYFSLDGEGMFNWRFVFPFEYDSIEKKIMIREKVSFKFMF